jgi:lysophospholipase L1-like esterase
VVWVIAELLIRQKGVMDFPLYDVDQEIGYIPRPNQNGMYLNRISWRVNGKNMTAGAWRPDEKPDLLLIGDSVVWGGEEYRHEEKLGPQLQAQLPDWSVWSVGASSWSISNEIAYLQRNPDVVEAADLILWVLNSGDFGPRALFVTDANTPRSRPWSANLYALRKYVLPAGFKQWVRGGVWLLFPNPQEPMVDPKDSVARLEKFLQELGANGKKTLILLYPSRTELEQRKGALDEFLQTLRGIQSPGLEVLDGRTLEAWGEGNYRDGIHPTVEGNNRLAHSLAKEVNR